MYKKMSVKDFCIHDFSFLKRDVKKRKGKTADYIQTREAFKI